MTTRNPRFVFVWNVVIVLTTSGFAAAQEKPYVPRPKGSLTFTKDVAPIVFKHCTACHRPGEVAPFSLITYRDVQKRAVLIKQVTASRLMPPWRAVAGHGEFRGARGLTAEQIGILNQWAQEGAVEGNPGDLPPAPKFAAGWQLGTPDLIVTMPKAFEVSAEGRDVYRNFVIPVEIPAGKYVRAAEYRPSNRRVVHHAILSLDKSGKAVALEGKDGKPGFTQINVAGELFPGHLSIWVPGQDARPLPDGVAMTWTKGTDFVLQLHLHPSGKVETEQSTIGFYFTSEPPTRSLSRLILNNSKIDIPAGEKAYRTQASRTLEVDTDIYGLFPHMHMLGKEVTVTALLPDGKRRSLLRIDAWDFNWQNYYEYKTPVTLPKGTKLVMECTHDNSADNPSNPNQPPKRVTFGEQTTNEMSAVLLYTMPLAPLAKGNAKRNIAQEAQEVMRRYDTTKDGKLSREEIEQIPAAAKKDIAAFIQRFDKDGDGQLNIEELTEAIRV